MIERCPRCSGQVLRFYDELSCLQCGYVPRAANMPMKVATACGVRNCPSRAVKGGKCTVHAAMVQREYDSTRGTRQARGYGAQWQHIRAEVLREQPDCVLCGAPATDVDHIVMRRNGGTDDKGNLQALCHSCHSRKTTREVR